MGAIIPLQSDPHREVLRLLPWYATGRLEPAEHGRAEAHLADCPDCAAELQAERRLRAEIAALPLDAEQDWAAMLQRLDAAPEDGAAAARRRRLRAGAQRLGGWLRVSAPWLGWALAAQVGVLLLIGALSWNASPSARYHALAAAPPAPEANLVVLFRPDATAAAIGDTLQGSDARVIDGPTAAGAYLLRAPPATRDQALTRLRASRAVLVVEPFDGPR